MCWRISYNSRQDSRQIRKSAIDKAFLLWYAETATVEVGLFFVPNFTAHAGAGNCRENHEEEVFVAVTRRCITAAL